MQVKACLRVLVQRAPLLYDAAAERLGLPQQLFGRHIYDLLFC